MKSFEGYFSLMFFTKPYLKKYLQSTYGSPVYLTKTNRLGMVLSAMMQRPERIHRKKHEIVVRLDKFTTVMEIMLPDNLKKSWRPCDLGEEQVITINKFFELQFCEELYQDVARAIVYKVELKKSIRAFCHRHMILTEQNDEDISMDAIIKKERRYRREKELRALTPVVGGQAG